MDTRLKASDWIKKMSKCPCCDPHFHLVTLYGDAQGDQLYAWLQERLAAFQPPATPRSLDQRDAILITYGDQFQRKGETPLQTLKTFGEHYLKGLVTGMHILPFYPYSSDDGFSVIDYRAVDSNLGSWEDIEALGQDYEMMFDAVINHISSESDWFQQFLSGDEAYADYFIHLPEDTDLSAVVRPRVSPLLTRYERAGDPVHVWTTFSADQIDLNYQNPEVLRQVVDILLMYVERGARFIRLDAIAYLWKEVGTTSIHLPNTHLVVQFLRAVLDEVAPYVALITETNVPHVDNISYFGNGDNEAQMVYNFALPPLVMHSYLTGSAARLTGWAQTLSLPSTLVTFFNFLASHDGIGLNPARGILSDAEIDAMVDRIQSHGGLVSSKTNPDGSASPYELNISYFDALSDPKSDEADDVQVRRFLGAQAILLSMVGVPGIYVHSLLGTRNWLDGVLETGRNRTINRRKFAYEEITTQLERAESIPAQVYKGYTRLLKARSASPAFHPYSAQMVVDAGEAIFGLLRITLDGHHTVLCLHNVAQDTQHLRLNLSQLDLPHGEWEDLISGQGFIISDSSEITLEGYQVLWLRSKA
jgi:glucosylglycerate phosphorylase